MAVRFDETSGKRLERTTSVLDFNSAYSISLWLYPISGPASGEWTSPVTIGDVGSGNGSEILQFANDLGTTQYEVYVQEGPNIQGSKGSNVTFNTWCFIWIVRESTTSVKLYLNGNLDITNTLNVGARGSSTGFGLGATRYNVIWMEECDARIANVKVWQAQLTTAELWNETYQYIPSRMANLHAWWPLFAGSSERLRDYSVNAKTFTEGVPVTDEPGPPITWSLWTPPIPIIVAAGAASNARHRILDGPFYGSLKGSAK